MSLNRRCAGCGHLLKLERYTQPYLRSILRKRDSPVYHEVGDVDDFVHFAHRGELIFDAPRLVDHLVDRPCKLARSVLNKSE